MLETKDSPVQVKPSASRFDYVKYDEESVKIQESVKYHFRQIEDIFSNSKDGRAKSLLLTYLEIAYMWAGKQIRDAQIARIGSTDVPERSNQ